MKMSKRLLDNYCNPSYYLVFIDEMPFMPAGMTTSKGWAPSGKHATVSSAPYSKTAYRTQVASSVHHEDRLPFADVYPPTKQSHKRKDVTDTNPSIVPSSLHIGNVF
eukprot:m.131696 g.131696  ORF g.131696 m.131696 type:complete len:107 (-) comp9477_c1_seq36:611-931(-)